MDAHGALLAYIEADGTVGAPDLEYLGEVTAPNADSKGFVTDRDDRTSSEPPNNPTPRPVCSR